MRSKCVLCVLVALSFLYSASAQTKRKVIIDQDARGPATTDQQSILVFLQSPEVEVLGITVVSGDMWRDEEMAHTLRMLELVGRTDVPVVPGAVYPIINRMELIERWEGLYGKVRYQGAWNKRPIGDGQRGVFHGPYEIPDLKEGNPTTKPIEEDAAHFIIRMLHKYPHEVTVYAGGPLTDLAQAISLDPAVPDLAQELVIMGGSIAPATPYPWATTNRREFNFWWDPESVHMTLTAPGWHKITITTVDISIKTRMDKAMIAEIGKVSKSSGAIYREIRRRRISLGRTRRCRLARSEHHHQANSALHGHGLLARARLRQYARLDAGNAAGAWRKSRQRAAGFGSG